MTGLLYRKGLIDHVVCIFHSDINRSAFERLMINGQFFCFPVKITRIIRSHIRYDIEICNVVVSR